MAIDGVAPLTGYGHANYARSLSEFGMPCYLPRSQSWVLERTISGTPYRDGMGCYPLFVCREWSQLEYDVNVVGAKWVSLTIVTDPFGAYTLKGLKKAFPDVCIPFKQHFVIDLEQAPETFVRRHHRRNARQGSRNVDVFRCDKPLSYLNDWLHLYDLLKRRHSIKGIAAFSTQAFTEQLGTPGLNAFGASCEGKTVAMLLWYVHGDVAYYHLGASNETGYALRAPFALFWKSIEYFAAEGLKWLDLGGVAGVSDSASGLRRFKAGWSTGTRTAYFCGRILDRARYRQLACLQGNSAGSYFPIYRVGEFG